nr:immunoglobulin heavy chain junction region [Homo sapiens]
DRRGHGRVL